MSLVNAAETILSTNDATVDSDTDSVTVTRRAFGQRCSEKNA